MRLTIYGLKNCDSCREACRTAKDAKRKYHFHDLRANGLTLKMIEHWLEFIPLEKLLNRRSTTWRNLDKKNKNNQDDAHLIDLILVNPTLIKRPLCDDGNRVTIGLPTA